MRYSSVSRKSGEKLPLSAIGFGCGPRAGAMVGPGDRSQAELIEAALTAGINYFDTAPLYGDGESEANLGDALHDLGAADVVVSTKVEIGDDLSSAGVRASLAASLRRLRRDRLDIVLVHNRVVQGFAPGDRPRHAPGPDLTVDELLDDAGPLAALLDARQAGDVGFVGLTGYDSDPDAVAVVLGAGVDALTVEYHALNPSAAHPVAPAPGSADYAPMARAAGAYGVTLIGLRPLAGAALLAPEGPGALLNEVAAEWGVTAAGLAWSFALHTGGPGTILGGFRNPGDLAQATGALEGRHTEALAAFLNRSRSLGEASS